MKTTAQSIGSRAEEKKEEIKKEISDGKDHIESMATKGLDHVKDVIQNNSQELIQTLANDLATGKALLIKELTCTVKQNLSDLSVSGSFLVDRENLDKMLLLDISSLVPESIEKKNYSVKFKASFDKENETFKYRIVDSNNPTVESNQISLSDLGLKADCVSLNKIVYFKDGIPQVDSDAFMKQINELSDTKKLVNKVKTEVQDSIKDAAQVK